MSHDTQELLNRLRAGDAEALAEFLELNRPKLLAYVERSLSQALRRKIEPQDVFQEVSLQALRYLGQTDLSKQDPFGWLCQLAQQRIVDAHRKFVSAQKRQAGREVGLEAQAGDSSQGGWRNLLVASLTSPSQALSRNQKEFRLQQALMTLPEESRQALRLRYVDGLPSKLIAERLGKSDGAIRVLLTRSLKRLQELLGVDDASLRG